MVKNIILDVGKVLVAWEPEDAMKQLGFDDKIVKAVADATVNTPVWLETDRGVWSDEQILQAFYEKAPEYKKEIDLFWNHLELAITQFSYTKEWISNMKKEGLQARLILQVHDELIVEAPENEKETVAKLLQEEMENAVKLSVPLTADAAVGRTWYDAKK